MAEKPLFSSLEQQWEQIRGWQSAGIWRRELALAIDFLLTLLPAGILGGIVALVVPPGPARDTVNPFAGLVVIALAVLYGAAMESSRYQATVGKILLKAMVTDLDEQRLSFRAALRRNIWKVVLVPIWLISAGMINWGKGGQALHDRLANTLVGIGRPRVLTPLTSPAARHMPSESSAIPTGNTITLWAADEQTAQQLGSDQYFLMGALMSDTSPAVKRFLEALDKGGSLSWKSSPNRDKGGYDVRITVKA